MTLIERIRCREYGSEDIDLCDELHEAADELESLRAQLKEAELAEGRAKTRAMRLEMELAEKDAKIEQLYSERGIISGHLIKKLHGQLAASQANEVQLREALETAAVTFTEYGDIHAAKNPPDLIKAEFNRDRAHLCLNALSLPSDTTALESMIQKAGEVMRERCGTRPGVQHVVGADYIRAIPGVTLGDLKGGAA